MANEFQLQGLVPPWRRRAWEYEAFFDLAELSKSTRILDCGAGPSSFAAEYGQSGRYVVATDPVYALSGRDISADFPDTAARMLDGARQAYHRFRWDRYHSPEAVVEIRRDALNRFLDDFAAASRQGRYVAARLPHLPFSSGSFDLVLCSHLLFLYSDEIDTETHVAAMREMLRVGGEVRIFPLLDMNGDPSPHLEPSLSALIGVAIGELCEVPFEFRPGDSRMLRLTKIEG